MVIEDSRSDRVRSEPQQRNLRPQPTLNLIDRFEIALMGTFCLRHCDVPVDLPGGAQRLVAIVALRGQTSRSRLAGMLWPDATEQRALASLRTGLWRVQHAAPEVLVAMGCTVEVHPRVRVDVREFVDQATRILDADETGIPLRLDYRYECDLLADWDDEWLISDRERLRQLRLHVLEALSERLTHDGRFGLAIEIALAALSHDMLRESAHRALIRAHLAEGNVSEARRAFLLCTRVLKDELGVKPSASTTELVAGFANPISPRSPAIYPADFFSLR